MEKIISGGKNLIISHASDIDGMSPAILARLMEKDIDIIFCEPIEILPVLKEIDPSKYQTIYITDLPINSNAALYIDKNKGLKVKIKHFDHHESDINSNYSFINEVVSTNGVKESAASLFYKYLLGLYPSNEILTNPLLEVYINAVRTNDTSEEDWLSDNPSKHFLLGRKITILLSLIGHEKFINKFIGLFKSLGSDIFTKEEMNMIAVREEYIANHIKKCDEELIKMDIKGRKVGVVITTEYRSEVGNALSKKYPELDYILIVDEKRRSFSFRTVRPDVNVFLIAKSLCSTGGGHPKAAGMPFCKENKWLFAEIKKCSR
ncbi:MAG TPA: hypothetical protein PLX66_00020 [Bacilli bacterium]|nr:hypothetical protein [Bacilli bacterium]